MTDLTKALEAPQQFDFGAEKELLGACTTDDKDTDFVKAHVYDNEKRERGITSSSCVMFSICRFAKQ